MLYVIYGMRCEVELLIKHEAKLLSCKDYLFVHDVANT